jgi:hypothetical protein
MYHQALVFIIVPATATHTSLVLMRASLPSPLLLHPPTKGIPEPYRILVFLLPMGGIHNYCEDITSLWRP